MATAKELVVTETQASEATKSRTEDPDTISDQRPSVLENHGYTLGRIIGTGSYATVKLARSERHQDQVAIKIVSKFQAPKDYLLRFLPREIEVVKGLRHPNLIKFLQAVETTHRVYIVMEYAEKGSLLDIIRKESHIDEDRAKNWFTQLADAVRYCHDHGVVHRDVKCENLLMDGSYNLKLSDFGFARGNMKPRSDGSPVLSETFCGSYAYASPEILKGIAYDPMLSDVWSMGVVLYAMVFGKLPFDDTNYNKLVKQVQSKLKFPSEPVVSERCKTMIGKLIAPLKTRLKVSQIPKEPWLLVSTDTVDKEVVKVNSAGSA
ncbi:testis-specific serine/threonine-protein kinase 3-like [Macrosteles quadrilineatus]|uniref:testis-specific serine/threonine-protein kinase 3-like n=1 Tax=Macrosteles quadrilineatus TaxID=74068 RepID=UPI0023E10D16|nr:testis-specific serine/threonine-protein kinase 3-like [Macrosteles quadrilineatus]